MDATTAQRQAQLFKALMHPVRLQILAALRGGEQCVCHLEAHLGLRQAYISQQLAILRNARLIMDRRDGLNIFYQVARPELFALLDTARALAGLPPEQVGPPDIAARCGCPKCAGEAQMVDRSRHVNPDASQRPSGASLAGDT